MRRAFRHCLLVLLVGLGALFLPAPSGFAQGTSMTLVVYERAGCAWCARWDNEVAPVYAKTAVGQQAPLRRVNLDQAKADDPKLDDPVRFTPTFVLLKDGKEVGRITGYQNDGFFWGLLEAMVERLGSPAPAGKAS
ncbi:MAG: thioredoxin family protein [Beijerinckiaceae bacterium]